MCVSICQTAIKKSVIVSVCLSDSNQKSVIVSVCLSVCRLFQAFHDLIVLFQSLCPTPNGFIDDLSNIRWSPVRNNDINWNFEKMLIDHKGQPRARYTAPYEPDDIRKDIRKLITDCQEEKEKAGLAEYKPRPRKSN